MRSSAIVVLTSFLFVTGCVNLDKPIIVANCSVSPAGCSDKSDKPPEPARDASLPDGPVSPDLSAEEVPVVPKDAPLNPDLLAADAPAADAPMEALPDVSAVPDARETADVASPDVLLPDVPSDLPLEALGGSDMGPDTGKSDSADVGLSDVGSDGRGDLGPDNPGSNCISQLISAGYVAGTAPACSKCLENGASLETKCKAMIDCLAPPCTKTTCYVNNYCLNNTGASSVVGDCVAALITAACPSGF